MRDKQRARFVKRRRLTLAALGGFAVGAFALCAALADGPPPPPSVASQLNASQLAGERIVLGFAANEPPAAVKRMVRAGEVAGVILFSENLPSRAVGRRLIGGLQAIPRPSGLRNPLLVMTDQEGGLVKRIGGAPTASARTMGARGAAFSREQGRRTAANLRNLGVNVDLAPVLDVARPEGTIAEADRGFGPTAASVAATAVPFATALQGGGVAATGKHFPGLGSARLNTDDAVQRIGLSKQTLRRVDEAPYRSFVASGGDLVMLSTAIYPAFSSTPAAFSPAIATGELRGRLGFDGVTITDALNTVAVHAFGGTARAALAAAQAGADLLLYTDPSEAAQAHHTLLQALRDGRLPRISFEESVSRVLKLRHGLGAGR
jgi:beta-N-acetylhexosaminidase